METFVFLLAVYIVFQTTVVLHELGHVLFGWLAGFRIETIQIGSGPIVFQRKVNRVRLRYGSLPFSGYVVGLPVGTSNFRMRWFAFAFGGPFVSVTIILFTLWIALGPVGAMNEMVRNGAWFLAIMETFCIVPNLIPGLSDGLGGVKQNDGMLMLNALFSPASDVQKQAEEMERLRFGLEQLENGAQQRREGGGKDIAHAYLRMVGFDEKSTALPLLKQRLGELDPEERASALVTLITQAILIPAPILQEDVDWMMEEALLADSKSAVVQATKGALLVLQGETDAGIEILEKVLSETSEKEALSTAGYFLALAYAADHYLQRSKEYWDKAFELDSVGWARFVVEPKIREYAERDRQRWIQTE